jgi:Zn-dependent peptidase ImmA (M78 family)
MIHSLELLKQKIPGFNKRQQTVDDFWRIVKRERIYVQFWKLRKGTKGFYGLNRRYKRPVKYIVISYDAITEDWLATAFHELIHHFLHAPFSSQEVYFSNHKKKGREDREAERFARMMIIPKPLLLELMHTPFEEIVGYSRELLIERKKDFELYGE